MARAKEIAIKVPAEADKLSQIRQVIAARAEALGADPRVVDDLRTVVSEACNNVILHAYPEQASERPLEVSLRQEQDDLRLVVKDRGRGIQPHLGDRPASLRMGLALVGALTSCFQLRSRRGGGTELTVLVPMRP